MAAVPGEGGIILDDSRQQRGRCSDSRDDWIGKASGYAYFDERYMTRRNQIESPKLPSAPPYGPALVLGNTEDILPGNVAAPSSTVTSHIGDNARSRACDIETTSCTTTRFPYAANCNVACSSIVPATCNNASASDDSGTTLYRDSGPQLETCAAISKSCQLGSVDVEDLAMYFDKPPATSNRAIHSRRSRYGQAARMDQPRQDRRDRLTGSECDLNTYHLRSSDLGSHNLRPCDLGSNNPWPSEPAAGDPRTCDLGSGNQQYRDVRFGDLQSYHLGTNISEFDDPRSSNVAFNNLGETRNSEYNDPRSYDVFEAYQLRFDDSQSCDLRLCEVQTRELGRDKLGRCDLGPDNWYCNNCPELFNFCSEKRWLQCPASDRCPLYDPSYAYGAPILPPCMYENLHADYNDNDNWHYGYAEDDQLLEDYLSNEKRKERSRDAARCRRSRETDIFAELAAALPVAPEQAAHLDKASVMRLAIAYLKVRAVIDSIPASLAKSESSAEMDELFPKALNGFMLVLSSDGNMVYLSENVNDYLGISQMDMMGQSVYEYSHPCDHDELRECLSSKPTDNNEKRACSFFLRLKCTLTSKGRKVNLKSASYKVIHCTGRLTNIGDSNLNSVEADDEKREKEDEPVEQNTGASLVLVGSPIPHPSNIEIPLGRHTFLSKHSLSMKFTYADEKLAEYLGWNSEELMGRSVFEFYHALDNLALDKCFKCLFSKGQCETVAYRFLGKRGGYAWVVTQATLIHCSKQQKPISVVCVNYILRHATSAYFRQKSQGE